jgi:peptide deformylase
MARVIQHEYDHLEGVLFIDKAEKIWLAEDESDDDDKLSD